jgi:hypothetical protein
MLDAPATDSPAAEMTDDRAEDAARRTTDSGTAATIFFDEAGTGEEPPNQGLAPLEGWQEDIRKTPRESTLVDVPMPVDDRPPAEARGTVAAEESSRRETPPADLPRASSSVRGTMMPDEEDRHDEDRHDEDRDDRAADAASAPVAASAAAATRPPREVDLPPAMRLVKRRGPLEHPATLVALSLLVIAAVAYLLFYAWPHDDGTRTVKVITAPAGAKVGVDGVASGEKTPAELKLKIGKHDIVVALDGHDEAKKSIDVAKEDPQQREIVLELTKTPTARLVRFITDPPDAAVFLDGDGVPLAAQTPAEEMLSLKRHTIVVKKPGFQDAAAEINVVRGDGPQVERIALSPVPKRKENVVVTVDPAAATVTAGGQPVAVSMGQATVPAEEDAPLELAVTLEGFADWSRTLSFEELEAAEFNVSVTLDPYVSFVPAEAAVKVNDAPLPLDGGRAVLPASPDRSYHIVAAAKGYKMLDVTLSRSELAERKFRLALPAAPHPPATLREVGDGRYVHDALDKAGVPLYFVVVAASDGIRSGELPRRAGRIHEPYLISTTEVSVRQYAIFAAAAGEAKAGSRWRPQDADAAADLPVTNVTHEQARNFAAYAGGALPSEMQWERAARGKEGRMYPWPERDGPSSDRCNLGYEGSEGLMPVDALKDGATPEGVLNMLGNAAEWCEEKYEPGHRDIDDKTPGMRKFPTIRGGSFLDPYDNTMRNARATMRANADPASGGEDIGIRVVVPFEGT